MLVIVQPTLLKQSAVQNKISRVASSLEIFREIITTGSNPSKAMKAVYNHNHWTGLDWTRLDWTTGLSLKLTLEIILSF